MSTYISLVNWTEQGLKDVKSTVERLDKGVAAGERYGVQALHTYWTVGPYDMVFIADAPDDESMTAYLLEICSAGNVRTLTLRAHDREGMLGILGRLA